MKTYKALVKDKKTKEYKVITSDYNNKSEFIKDLRNNGYMVNPIKVKTKEVYDYIVNSTNCCPWDWKENN